MISKKNLNISLLVRKRVLSKNIFKQYKKVLKNIGKDVCTT